MKELLQDVNIVSANPITACSDELRNQQSIQGNIAVALRGTCDFSRKAKVFDWAKASGVVIINSENNAFPMEAQKTDDRVNLPVFMTSSEQGEKLVKLIQKANASENLTLHAQLSTDSDW